VGFEARYQAIPEDCELLARARKDREIAELMQFFNSFALEEVSSESPTRIFFANAVKELMRERPGLIERYLHNRTRGYDRILYLLSPARRARDWKNDQSLIHIHKAIRGSERLHPEARATQGHPIGFVPAKDVQLIADYLDIVTYEGLHEHYNPSHMAEMGVYKIWAESDEAVFQSTWEEFTEMRNLYRAAADHNEAVITVID
jgi:hypothetical protein